jgi:hypothetical protein
MDDEKLEKTMEFILNNQAQFTIDIQKLQESQKEGEKRVNVLERVCLNLYNTSVEQGKNIAQLSGEIKKAHEIHEREMSEIRASQKETDERLNAVILMAEKFFSGENGGSKKKK